jgi:glutamine amidotransferase
MCRLFAMSGGRSPVAATFWLLEAPDSLSEQSRRNPDGTGLGWFDADGTPRVDKQPLAGYEDAPFATAARAVSSRTFVAHVRYASTGAVALENTHPFEQHGRLFAHNGALEDLDAIEARLTPATRALIAGDTDSERLFALITDEIEAAGGDVGTGIAAAVRWAAQNVRLFAINFVLTTPDAVWALRYPEPNELHVLDRPARREPLDHRTAAQRIAVRSEQPGDAVVIASEPMDDDPAWRAIASGELVHVDADCAVTTVQILDAPPAHQLTLADLDAGAKASQQVS